MKYLIVFLIIASFSSMMKIKGYILANPSCNESILLIKKAVSAKVEYEKAVYFKSRNYRSYKQQYSNLVKTLKQKDKLEGRKECIRQLILQDSLSPIDTVVVFTYKSPVSSNNDVCDMMLNWGFLKTILMNLNDPNNDSTLVCDPLLVKRQR